MGVDRAIDITAKQRKTILALLERHLPNTTAWVYGSRAKWASRPQSDLDMVVFSALEQNGRVSDLREAFEESNLPFRVDLFVWDAVPEQFRKQIKRDHVVVCSGGKHGMEDKWAKLTPLRDLCKSVVDCHHSTPVWTDTGVIVLRNQNIRNGRLDLSEPSYTDERHYAERTRRAAPRSDDLVITREAPMGEVCMVPAGLRCCLGQRMVLLRPDPAKTVPRYLLYALQSKTVRHEIGVSEGTGSTVSNLRIPLLEALPIPSRRLPEQRAIAHILGTLDDKIELNRRMNETLEAMARALFKSWFVDFDPVRAKMAGRDTGLPQVLADLFPDRLVNSDLGEIPEGWEDGALGDIAFSPRRSVKPASLDGETPYIGLEHMPRHSIALTEWENVGKVTSNKSIFEKGEVLFGKLRPYFHKVGTAPVDGVCSTDVVVIVSKATEWSAFALACVSSVKFVSYTNQASTGTKMPRTSWKIMGDYRMCLPTAPVARAFQNVAHPVLEHIIANIHESRTLASLRDTLLPKLVSGEVRVTLHRNELC